MSVDRGLMSKNYREEGLNGVGVTMNGSFVRFSFQRETIVKGFYM